MGTYYFFRGTSAIAYDYDDSNNTTRNSAKDRDISSIISGLQAVHGATATDNRIAIVGQDARNRRLIYIFDHAWNRITDEDITPNLASYTAIAATDTEWVLLNDTNDRLEFWSFAGVENVSKRHNFAPDSWQGIFTDGTYIYAINDSDDNVQRRTYLSTTLSTFISDLGTGIWRGGTSTSTRFVLVNFLGPEGVFYNHSGILQSSEEITVAGSGQANAVMAIADQPKAVITASTTDTDIRAGESVNINFVSDIDITGFTASDVTVTNGTRGALTRTDAKNYVLAVTAGSAGMMTVAMDEDVVSPGNAAVSKDFTVKLALPSVPGSLAATVVDHDSIRITFDASTGTVSRYEYRYATSTSGLSSASWRSSGTSRSVTIDGLSPNTLYYFQVRAVNRDGNSAASSAVSARTDVLVVAPGTPGTLTTTAVDHDTIRLSFGASSGTVTQYQYRVATSQAGLSSVVWVNGGTGTTIDVDNLSANTEYFFQVRAGNQGRWSAATAAASATTQTAPKIIGTHYFVQDNGNAIAYDFDKDNNTTKNSAKDRNLNTLTGATRVLGAVATGTRIAVLDSGTTKAIRILNRDFTRVSAEDVTLSNQIYTAICATDDRWVVSRATPSWRLEFWDFDGTEQVSERQTPSTRGNNGLFSYDDYIYIISNIDDNVSRRTFDSTTISTFISSLGTGSWNGGAATSSRFIFVNDSGDTAVFANHAGTIQSAEQITLPAGTYVAVLSVEDVELTAPSVPASLKAAAVDHDTIRLSFTRSTGTVTQYQYRVATTSGGLSSATWISGGTGTTIDVDNLNPSTRYYFQVRALNQTVASGASNTADTTTSAAPIVAPSVPSGLSAIAVDHDTVRLSFTRSTGTVTKYQYKFATSEAGLSSAGWMDGGTGTTITIDGLSASTRYYFQVRALNQTVPSAASNTADATTQAPPIVAPSTPASLSATVLSHDTIRLVIGASTGTVTVRQYRYATSEAGLSSATWQDASATTVDVGGLSPSTTYYFQARAGNQGVYSAASTIASATTTETGIIPPLPPGPLFIESVDEQFIPINTEDYELIIRINRLNVDARVQGLQEGFYQTFRKLENGNSEIIIKSDLVTRLIGGALWVVNVRDKDDGSTASSEIIYNVVLVAPILIDPGPQEIYKGIPFELLVEVLNQPGLQTVDSEIVGLKSEVAGIEDRSYVKSAGILPFDSELTFDKFDINSYVENEGGNDRLAVPVSIRDDAVAPTIRSIANISRNTGYAQFTIQASVSAGTPPITWSVQGPEGATISEDGLITVPGGLDVGTYRFSVTASNGLYEDVQQFSLTVQRPAGPVVSPPIIRNIANTARPVGYSEFTIQASLISGSAGTWSVSGVPGVTINSSGLITIPAGLPVSTDSASIHRITVMNSNSAGSDTETFSFIVNPSGVAPIIRSISNVARRSGYAQFTIQASLTTGTTAGLHWRISGIAGATISTSGLITIPAGLSAATYTATVTASNTDGSDTEQFSLEVTAAAPTTRKPSGTITLTTEGRDGEVGLSWNHPSDRGVPTATYTIGRRLSFSGDAYATVASGVTGTSYTDDSVTNHTTYQYRVQAVNSEGSINSNEPFERPEPPASVPVISSISDMVFVEDSGNHTIDFTVTGYPVPTLTYEGDTRLGSIILTPSVNSPNARFRFDANTSPRDYTFTIRASSTSGNDSERFTITVTPK